ncbi:MAG: oxidoreductase, partial [Chitinophagaceae bacterium]|nr:oxidoreductase [Chitinophagaceae bacterium]
LHPAIIALKEKIQKNSTGEKHKIKLHYITSRGNWYHISWKGDVSKSGGIATNIGVHFFDMLMWIFGDVKENIVHNHTAETAAGKLVLENAEVDWLLSIDADNLPEEAKQSGKRTYRSLMIDGESFEFSEGFTELHNISYEQILNGKGFSLSETRKAIQLVHDIRNAGIK